MTVDILTSMEGYPTFNRRYGWKFSADDAYINSLPEIQNDRWSREFGPVALMTTVKLFSVTYTPVMPGAA